MRLSKKRKQQLPQDSQDSQKSKVSQSQDTLSHDISENVNRLKKEFLSPRNTDFKVKPLFIHSLNKKGILCFLNGTINNEELERHVLEPLLYKEVPAGTEVNTCFLMEHVLTTTLTEQETKIKKLVKSILIGGVVLLIEDYAEAVLIGVRQFDARSVEKPENETVIKGPKESFVEQWEVNLSLIRKQIKNQHLVTEKVEVGKGGENQFYLVYMDDISNKDLVSRVKKRMGDIKSTDVLHLSSLEQHIEERPYSLVPSCLLTERPDRACAYLKEGHVAILNDVSPFALITPVTFFTLFQTSEDYYERWAFGNFIRLIRIFAVFVALLVPGIYIAATNYSPEMLQTDLLLAIAATREVVPFPTIVEVLIMELIFELLREAGVRIPNPIGPTIGIVGALILGQAAVQANVVSPIIVIVVSLTGLSSFAIPEINLSYIVRLLRFAFLFASAILGFFGMALLVVWCLAYMSSLETFGVHFLSPMAPHKKSSGDMVYRPPLWKLWLRPQNLNPKKDRRAPKPKRSTKV